MSTHKSAFVLRALASNRTAKPLYEATQCIHETSSSKAPSPTTSLDHIEAITNTDSHVKSMDELPGPPGWPLIGNFLTYLKKKNQGRIHLVQAEYHKKFGRLFREKWGTKWQVHVSDPDLMEHIYRNQGHYPNRPGIQAWNLHRKLRNIPNGLIISQGEEWYRMRSLLDKKLLSPTECTKFFEPLKGVTDDLITKLRHMRDTAGDENLARGLAYESYKWGMECAGMLLFDRRLGCLDLEMNPGAVEYIEAFNQMLSSSMKLIVGEKVHQKLNTRLWQQHAKSWDKILSTAEQYCKELMEKNAMVDEQTSPVEASGCPFHAHAQPKPTYLRDVIASGNVTLAEVFTNFSEIMFAAADTTSNTLCFLLQLLATNPEVQDRLREEIDDVMQRIGPDVDPVGRMSYLDAVIKETFRVYPLATMQCRILNKDLIIAGHLIPSGTMFVMNHWASSRDPKHFEDPEEFRPERWIRDSRYRLNHHPFASMPFGYGKRMCLGKRLARLELHMAVSKIMQNFKVEPIEGMEFDPVVMINLTPGNQIPIRFVNR